MNHLDTVPGRQPHLPSVLDALEREIAVNQENAALLEKRLGGFLTEQVIEPEAKECHVSYPDTIGRIDELRSTIRRTNLRLSEILNRLEI